MICSKCRVLCGDVCPLCGKTKHLREPEPNEPTHLITLNAMQTMLVEPVLEETGIPYFKQNAVGNGLTTYTGMMGGIYRFFVPASARQKCADAIEDVFGEDETLMRLLHEFDIREE